MQRRGHPWNRRSVITLLLAAALSASAVANPSEKMASKTPSGPKNSAAAGASSWKPTGGRTIAVVGPHPYTGKFRLRVAYDPRTGCKKDGRVWITSEHADYPGAPSFLGLVPQVVVDEGCCGGCNSSFPSVGRWWTAQANGCCSSSTRGVFATPVRAARALQQAPCDRGRASEHLRSNFYCWRRQRAACCQQRGWWPAACGLRCHAHWHGYCSICLPYGIL